MKDGIGVAKAVDGYPAQHMILKLKKGLPACDVARPPASLREALRAGSVVGEGDVRVLDSNRRQVMFHATVAKPCVLLAVQKYAPDWQATVDGERTKML